MRCTGADDGVTLSAMSFECAAEKEEENNQEQLRRYP
jgi:hypothetical protein